MLRLNGLPYCTDCRSFEWPQMVILRQILAKLLKQIIKGEVEDIRLEAKAKAKDKKNPRPRIVLPRTHPLETTDKNARGQGPRAQTANVLQKKSLKNFFQAIYKKKGLQNFFSGDLQNFNDSKNSAVLKPMTGQFSRT